MNTDHETNNRRKAMMILHEKRRILAAEQEITHHTIMIDEANGVIEDAEARIAAIGSGNIQ